MYETEKYDEDQLDVLLKGRDKDNKEYGNIDDLAPEKYNGYQMERISLGRGNNKKYGNIDDLDPNYYDWRKMKDISLGRGKKIK